MCGSVKGSPSILICWVIVIVIFLDKFDNSFLMIILVVGKGNLTHFEKEIFEMIALCICKQNMFLNMWQWSQMDSILVSVPKIANGHMQC
jgi:hypothetical protein